MKKIVLAINHKETEDKILELLKDSYICNGRATYREAVLPMLKDSNVDVLIIRDSLNGTIQFPKLIEEIRIESPMTSIICITKERKRSDPLLAMLVSYGIYDIINKDKVSINEIIYHVNNPNNFRDVSMYYTGVKKVDHPELETEDDETEENKSPGLFGGLFGGKKQSGKSQSQFSSTGGQKVNIDAENLRTAIREEERRKAQEGIKQLIQDEVQRKTSEKDEELQQANKTIAELKSDLRAKNSQVNQAIARENDSKITENELRKQMELLQKQISEMQNEHSRQLESLRSTEDTEWFRTEILKKEHEVQSLEQEKLSMTEEIKHLEEEIQKAKQSEINQSNSQTFVELEQAKKEIEKLRKNLSLMKSSSSVSYDLSGDDSVLNIQYNQSFLEPKNGQTHSIVFMGTKHGVGNTTIAMNTAVALSQRGYKVLYMEFNRSFPMINHFFEFVDVTNGIDTACDGMLSNNTIAVDKAIICPHNLKPKKRALQKAYKRLPTGLHFMVYSNGYLTEKRNTLDERAVKDLFYYLTMQLQYGYIIIDIQPDDDYIKDLFLQSGFLADKLIFTMNQDTHSVASAGVLIENLAQGRSAGLIQNCNVVLNRYQEKAAIKQRDIQRWLKLDNHSMMCMTDDPVIYLDSGSFGVPYACSRSPYAKEYQQIVKCIVGS